MHDLGGFCRILDQWSRLCSVQGTPFAQPSKISDEFKKRINREGTAEAKEKLNFHGCDLTDAQVSFLLLDNLTRPQINLSGDCILSRNSRKSKDRIFGFNRKRWDQ